jgi:hypothetical protein
MFPSSFIVELQFVDIVFAWEQHERGHDAKRYDAWDETREIIPSCGRRMLLLWHVTLWVCTLLVMYRCPVCLVNEFKLFELEIV